MHTDANHVRSLFLAAVENHAPDQWGAYLDEVCARDADAASVLMELSE